LQTPSSKKNKPQNLDGIKSDFWQKSDFFISSSLSENTAKLLFLTIALTNNQ